MVDPSQYHRLDWVGDILYWLVFFVVAMVLLRFKKWPWSFAAVVISVVASLQAHLFWIAGLAGFAIWVIKAWPTAVAIEKSRQTPCSAQIDEKAGTITVNHHFIHFELSRADRAIKIYHVDKNFVSNDAPLGFKQRRGGTFGWPFSARSRRHEEAKHIRNVSVGYTSSGESVTIRGPGETYFAPTDLRDVVFSWKEPDNDTRVLFAITGHPGQFKAIEEAVALFSKWMTNPVVANPKTQEIQHP